MYYDWAVTFSREVDFFWGSRITGASIIFLMNRYLLYAYYSIELFIILQDISNSGSGDLQLTYVKFRQILNS